ncbi:hypothetical protein D3C75_1303470 [compost metagenome]
MAQIGYVIWMLRGQSRMELVLKKSVSNSVRKYLLDAMDNRRSLLRQLCSFYLVPIRILQELPL